MARGSAHGGADLAGHGGSSDGIDAQHDGLGIGGEVPVGCGGAGCGDSILQGTYEHRDAYGDGVEFDGGDAGERYVYERDGDGLADDDVGDAGID
jgi:hypothetical protein